ncbi:butyrophilin subfamily 2 member A2-like [Numenius arquata]|uniref:butyrophilin subfamily 2 member A2-like n=1 Tax=Numenius arquata TaxID=31919 RepID=UPI003D30461C
MGCSCSAPSALAHPLDPCISWVQANCEELYLKDVVTLDPNTAHSKLVLSEDLRSVRCGPTRRNLPDNPERFSYWCCVLGQERCWEGRHCWEVEQENIGPSWWAVGVARESVERKGTVSPSPEEGVWGIDCYDWQLTALTSPRTALPWQLYPTRIWVCLDCTRGLVTFLSADTGVTIFTFPPASFRRATLHPWFWVQSEKTHLYLKGSTPQTLSPASIPTTAYSRPCPSPETPHSPLLDAAGDVPLCPAPAQGAKGE